MMQEAEKIQSMASEEEKKEASSVSQQIIDDKT